MIRWTWSTLPSLALALALGACTPPPDEVSTTTLAPGSDSSTTSTTATTPGNTTPGGTTMGGSQGGTGMDPTMGPADTTAGTTTTEGGTTSDVSATAGSSGGGVSSSGSSSGGPPPECVIPSDCDNNETCDGGACVSVCPGGWGPGDYAYCLTPLGTYDSSVLCGEPMTCINSGNPTEVVVCGRTCNSLCECPEAPPTGDPTVTCGNIAGGGGNECYLSCANSEPCPDGMVCRNSTFCAHPVQPLAMYGNCGDVAAPCDGGTCSMSGGHSVCVSLCPGGVGDCDAPPPDAAFGAACAGVISPPMGFDCYLPCDNDGNCPAGMDCIDAGGADNLCMWP